MFNNKTVRKIKNPQSEKSLKLEAHVQKTLGIGQIEQAILLPEGEDLNEFVLQ